jgi:hypothetical protein
LKSLVTEICLKELNELESPKFDFSRSPSLMEKLFIKTKANQMSQKPKS